MASLEDLPIVERIQLVEELWNSIAIDQNSLSVSEKQMKELNRRLNAFDFDQDQGRPAGNVLSQIQKSL